MTVDLFNNLEELPVPVRRVCKRFLRILDSGQHDSIDVCFGFLDAIKDDGYTFDIRYDIRPVNLRKINQSK